MSTPVQTCAGPWRNDVARARADLEVALGLVTGVGLRVDSTPPSIDERQQILDARRLAESATSALERAWVAVRGL